MALSWSVSKDSLLYPEPHIRSSRRRLPRHVVESFQALLKLAAEDPTLAAVALSSLAGCVFRPIHLGPAEHVAYDASRPREVSGHACGFMLAGIIPIALSDRDERAYRVMTEDARGDYIAQIDVQEHMAYAFAGWVICTNLRGTAYPRM
jgi:hypothetical protein